MEPVFISQPQRIAGEITASRYDCRDHTSGTFASAAPRKVPVNHLQLRTRSGIHHRSYQFFKLYFFSLYLVFNKAELQNYLVYVPRGCQKVSDSGEGGWFYPKATSLQPPPHTKGCTPQLALCSRQQPTLGRFMFSQMKLRKSLFHVMWKAAWSSCTHSFLFLLKLLSSSI